MTQILQTNTIFLRPNQLYDILSNQIKYTTYEDLMAGFTLGSTHQLNECTYSRE